ncbi:MAG: hypothetical protein L3J96_01155 [Thermoplasmata archaeon]|nr:hypothetical protein [Thermoplasmata archaeon]
MTAAEVLADYPVPSPPQLLRGSAGAASGRFVGEDPSAKAAAHHEPAPVTDEIPRMTWGQATLAYLGTAAFVLLVLPAVVIVVLAELAVESARGRS